MLKLHRKRVTEEKLLMLTEFQDGSSGKRYKFVVTGHGKYEKVSVDDGCEDTICHSGKTLDALSISNK